MNKHIVCADKLNLFSVLFFQQHPGPWEGKDSWTPISLSPPGPNGASLRGPVSSGTRADPDQGQACGAGAN